MFKFGKTLDNLDRVVNRVVVNERYSIILLHLVIQRSLLAVVIPEIVMYIVMKTKIWECFFKMCFSKSVAYFSLAVSINHPCKLIFLVKLESVYSYLSAMHNVSGPGMGEPLNLEAFLTQVHTLLCSRSKISLICVYLEI